MFKLLNDDEVLIPQPRLGIGIYVATIITMIPFFFAVETWPEEKRQIDSVWQATVQTMNIARDGSYLAFITVIMIITIPIWAYLAVCSYVYYEYFGVSNIQYSVLYACGTIASMSAPFVYIAMSGKISSRKIVVLTMVMLAAAAVLFMVIGHIGPVLFLVAMIPVFMAEGIVRPLSMVVVLERYPNEAGSASAVTGFILMMIGVIGSAIATLKWSSFIFGIAMISAACVILSAIIWIKGRTFIQEEK